MNSYFFTFGTSHKQTDGTEMYSYWVRVIAASHEDARNLFIKEWSSKYMPRPMDWAFQYDEADFQKVKHYFSGKEYVLLVDAEPGEANLNLTQKEKRQKFLDAVTEAKQRIGIDGVLLCFFTDSKFSNVVIAEPNTPEEMLMLSLANAIDYSVESMLKMVDVINQQKNN